MKSLFLITARGGSKGIPHKNIKLLNGKPLICYSIDIARKFVTDENICLSTDDSQIKDVAEKYGLSVPFLRPEYLATDTASSNDVIIHALDFYISKGINYDVVVLLQPTSPLRTEDDVKNCLECYTSDIDMVTTVKKSSVSAVLCKENESGFLERAIEKNSVRRQDATPLYEYNGAVYVINVKAIREKGLNGFSKIKKSIMDEESSVDIDTPLDFKIAEMLLKERK